MAKTRHCKNCNTELVGKSNVCPACGAVNKKPIYKRVWFWILIIIVICGIGLSGGDDTDSSDADVNNDVTSNEVVDTSDDENKDDADNDGIRDDFKSAMDSYEDFFDKYVDIVEKYEKNPNDVSILTDYTEYMGKFTQMMSDFEAWEDEDLNAAESAYYLEVQTRITKKLLEVSQ